MEEKIKVNELHKLLRKARYFYYEKSESIITDFEYDTTEKQYDELCDRLGVHQTNRVTNFVGWNDRIPRSVFYEELGWSTLKLR